MRINAVQSDLAWENREQNLARLGGMIAPLIGNSDIVILPETFTTGFTMNTEAFAEPPDGITYNWMKDIAIRGNMALCGSYIVKDEDRYFNRLVFVTPCEDHFYNKRHLFSIGEENKHFAPGNKRVVFTFRETRISLFICYDLRFPVWSRNRGDYDLAIYVANWPEARINVWNTLLKARAIENQCYVAGVNRIGKDGEGRMHTGSSRIINPRGEIIADAGGRQEVINSDISIGELSEFREKFNVLRDADEFEIII